MGAGAVGPTGVQLASGLDLIVLVTVVLVIYHDVTARKIPNYLTVGLALAGLVVKSAAGGTAGALDSLAGLFFGGGLLLLPYLLGGVGAGDVKFLAAVGAAKGWSFVLSAGLYGALAGGVMALLALARQAAANLWTEEVRALPVGVRVSAIPTSLLPVLWREARRTTIPYGVALGLGTLGLLLFGG